LKLAKYFNVTTDYLLCLIDLKRDWNGQIKLNEKLDESYEFVECFGRLDEYDKELLWTILQQMNRNAIKGKKEGGRQVLSLAVCDDDIPITGMLEKILEKVSKENFIDIEINVFFDGEKLSSAVERGDRFDIIYLDIEMKAENGIVAAKRIRKYDKKVYIVYVTNHENYMRSSFDVRPFRFLLKPVNEKEVRKSFLDAYDEISAVDYYFRYKYRKSHFKILIADVLYFESQKRKIKIKTLDSSFEMYGKLNDIQKMLGREKSVFLRVHQSYLINYRHVLNVAYEYVIMNNLEQIPISEDRRKKISVDYCRIGDILDDNENGVN
jgi:DNA-binding LytR/AlgR family response regulator